MVKLDEILEAVKYKEAAKKKEEKKTCNSLDSGDYRHRCGCGSSCLCSISLSDSGLSGRFLTTTLTMILRTRIWTRRNLKKKLPKEKKED